MRYVLCLHFYDYHSKLDWYRCLGWTTDKALADKFQLEQDDEEAEEAFYLEAEPEHTHIYHKMLLDGAFDGNEASGDPDSSGWVMADKYTFDGTDLTRRIRLISPKFNRKDQYVDDVVWKQYRAVIDEHYFSCYGLCVDIKTQEVLELPEDIIELMACLYHGLGSYEYLDLTECSHSCIDLHIKLGQVATYDEILDKELKSWSDILEALNW